jgi:hypothetical protein
MVVFYLSGYHCEIPANVAIEMLDDYARKKENERRRAAYKANPERAMKYRVTSAINLLRSSGYIVNKVGEGVTIPGYTVIRGELPEQPWTDEQKKMLVDAMDAAYKARKGRAAQ